ncbi:MAG TPA: MBL fold metallo-hydrolase [Casimicrobiaceae bacterium]|nr:MBL fold metallo-hydrolase [Casimicrobiaceae bacterium]
MNAALPAALEYPIATPPAPGETIEIAPRIHWLRMPLPFALDHINLWLLADDDGMTLVDCGFGDPPTRALWDRHFATTLESRPIRRIIATHCHPDHVGNAAWLSERAGAAVAMTLSEFLTAHALVADTDGYATRATLELFARHGLAADKLAALEGRGNRYRRGVPELPSTFLRLREGGTRIAAGTTWRVIEGFGHSPQHASLHSAERGVLIAGDMLLPKISTNVSVQPIEPDGDPLALFLDSLSTFETLPPDTLVLPSHGLPFRGIPVRVAQLRAHHAARLAELEQAVSASSAPSSAAELVPVLFRRELDVHQLFFAMGEAIAHLNHLWHAGRLERGIAADGTLRFAASPR